MPGIDVPNDSNSLTGHAPGVDYYRSCQTPLPFEDDNTCPTFAWGNSSYKKFQNDLSPDQRQFWLARKVYSGFQIRSSLIKLAKSLFSALVVKKPPASLSNRSIRKIELFKAIRHAENVLAQIVLLINDVWGLYLMQESFFHLRRYESYLTNNQKTNFFSYELKQANQEANLEETRAWFSASHPFSLLCLSYAEFERNLTTKDRRQWVARKVFALPKFRLATIRAGQSLSRVMSSLMDSATWTRVDPNFRKLHLFKTLRHAENALAQIVVIFHDTWGHFLMEKSSFHLKKYDTFLSSRKKVERIIHVDETLLILAEEYARLGKKNEGLETLSYLINSKNIDRTKLLNAFILLGEPEKGVDSLLDSNRNQDMVSEYARILFEKKLYVLAAKVLKQSGSNYKSGSLRKDLHRHLLDSGQPEEAWALIEKLDDSRPYAEEYFNRGLLNEAIKTLSSHKTYSLEQNYVDLKKKIFARLLDQKRYEDARLCADDLVAIEGWYSASTRIDELTDIYCKKGLYAEAVRFFKRHAKDEWSDQYNKLFNKLLDLNRTKEAKNLLTSSLPWWRTREIIVNLNRRGFFELSAAILLRCDALFFNSYHSDVPECIQNTVTGLLNQNKKDFTIKLISSLKISQHDKTVLLVKAAKHCSSRNDFNGVQVVLRNITQDSADARGLANGVVEQLLRENKVIDALNFAQECGAIGSQAKHNLFLKIGKAYAETNQLRDLKKVVSLIHGSSKAKTELASLYVKKLIEISEFSLALSEIDRIGLDTHGKLVCLLEIGETYASTSNWKEAGNIAKKMKECRHSSMRLSDHEALLESSCAAFCDGHSAPLLQFYDTHLNASLKTDFRVPMPGHEVQLSQEVRALMPFLEHLQSANAPGATGAERWATWRNFVQSEHCKESVQLVIAKMRPARRFFIEHFSHFLSSQFRLTDLETPEERLRIGAHLEALTPDMICK